MTLKKCVYIAALAWCMASAHALNIGNDEAAAGLRAAISRAAEVSVTALNQPDGFLGNPKVRIALPQSLQSAEGVARQFGMGGQLDQLVGTMNRAAESAVSEARPLLLGAVKKMSFGDAKAILRGGPDAATQYFKRTTAADLNAKFLPVVQRETAKLQLASQYNDMAGRLSKFGLVDRKDANLDHYITSKALDGLFLMIAEQEQKIRADPLGTGSNLLKKVFGAVAP